MSTTREAGDRGEAMAAEYLRENGYEILASQFRCQAAAYPHYGGLLHDAARS